MRLVWLVLVAALGVPPLAADRRDYRAVQGVQPDGRWAWRAWTEAGEPRLLVVDPSTLETAVVAGVVGSPGPIPDQSTLGRLRAAAQLRRTGLQNAGIRRADPGRPGAWLTFDLCPSSRPLDRTVLVHLEADATPLPIMVEVSGRWLETHPDDADWLVAERRAGRLALTWVNHTENHRYLHDVPLSQNFLLLPGTDLEAEVFRVEERLLDRGEVPSVFFRFPGLVSSPELVDRVLALGLVPLGSSAWLAKDQKVRSGALVLTHANGNEPVGEARLEAWDHGHKADLAQGLWHWLGLSDWADATVPPP